jgi:hypothetical protein
MRLNGEFMEVLDTYVPSGRCRQDVVLLEKVEIVHSRRRVTAINKNLKNMPKK